MGRHHRSDAFFQLNRPQQPQESVVSSSRRRRAMTDAPRPHPVSVDLTRQRLVRLHDDVSELLTKLSEAETLWSRWLAAIAPEHRASARNLVHYWSIRQTDLRDLQSRLAGFGLSSLGRSEPHVEATLSLVASAISAMLGGGWEPPEPSAVRIDDGNRMLRKRATELLGPAPAGRATRIMVTLPSEAADDPALIRALVDGGMNIARINCAHDDADAWRAMARHVREAAETSRRAHRCPAWRASPCRGGGCAAAPAATCYALGTPAARGESW